MGEDRIKDVEIKTECSVWRDVVQHQVRHRCRNICFFPFQEALSCICLLPNNI